MLAAPGLSHSSACALAVRCGVWMSGPGHQDADAASVRTNIPISQSTGLFFYEVTIMSKGRHGYIGAAAFLPADLLFCSCTRAQVSTSSGIWHYLQNHVSHPAGVGFCIADFQADRLPGWEPHSYGYHGDDGHAFQGSGKGRAYGPTYTTGALPTGLCPGMLPTKCWATVACDTMSRPRLKRWNAACTRQAM
jgi:hypothetical protein